MTVARICIGKSYRAYRAQIRELPGRFDGDGVTLHAGRNLIKTLILSSPECDSIEVAVKAFAVPARPRGVVYASLRQSKARRSMLNAQKLVEMGINTPDPVACIEYREFGCLRRSYYVCRYWQHDHDLTALLYRGVSCGPNTEVLLDQLARFTAAQHGHGVIHRDYNPGNILVRSKDGGFDFSIVDLNRLRFKPLDMKDRISGLVRLTTVTDYLKIIGRQYAKACGIDTEDFCRRLEEGQHRFQARRRRMKGVLSLFRTGT